MAAFLDLTKLSDDELIKKLHKSYEYLRIETNQGHNSIVNSIQNLIEQIEYEKEQRFIKSMIDDSKRRNPKVVNSIEIGKVDDAGDYLNEAR